jgi:hypothetical protein
MDLIRTNESMSSFVCLSEAIFQITSNVTVSLSETIKIRKYHLTIPIRKIASHRGDFLLEIRPYTTATKGTLKKDVRALAEILVSANTFKGILDITGYTDNVENRRLVLVFSIPQDL